MNERRVGGSGRRKITIADLDGDGRLDLLVNSENASFYRNLGEENGVTVLRDEGLIDSRLLAGHTSSPTLLDLDGNGVPGILIGAEDGFLYYINNPHGNQDD